MAQIFEFVGGIMPRKEADDAIIHKVLMMGRRVGAGRAFWKKLAHDEKLFRKVVAFVEGDGVVVESAVDASAFQPTQSQIRTREILGKNFLGIEEVMRYYGVAYTQEQLDALAIIPFSKSEIEERKNDFLLVAGAPITVVRVRAKAPSKKPRKAFFSTQHSWYSDRPFATEEKVGVGWFWVRKAPIEGSYSKTIADQQLLVPAGEEVPRVCELVYAVVLYFMATDERLFRDADVRCVEGPHVGSFGSDGLGISHSEGGRPHRRVGVSSIVKPKSPRA